MSRPLTVLLVHPGASWSTADVEAGVRYGLQQHGVVVVPYRLDERIEWAHGALRWRWRVLTKARPDLPKPSVADIQYHASVGALEMALRRGVDAVVIVSAMLFHPDVILMMKRAGLVVTVVFTESPYDHEDELRVAAMVDGCWTNERSVLADFQQACPFAGYLPHAWHPERHYVAASLAADVPAHDVVFVGSGFPERITWFNAIDWSGIDLGLYGTWKGLGLKKQVKAAVRMDQVNNHFAGALYRRAKIGLNLYRRMKGWGGAGEIRHAESLSPRAYELAACGAFSLSEFRAEVPEVFGDLVPTFTTPAEAEAAIRQWVVDDAGRARVSAALPGCVMGRSWTERARLLIGDLARLVPHVAAA